MFKASRVLVGSGIVGAVALVWLALGLGGVFTASGAPAATTTATTTTPAATTTAATPNGSLTRSTRRRATAWA